MYYDWCRMAEQDAPFLSWHNTSARSPYFCWDLPWCLPACQLSSSPLSLSQILCNDVIQWADHVTACQPVPVCLHFPAGPRFASSGSVLFEELKLPELHFMRRKGCISHVHWLSGSCSHNIKPLPFKLLNPAGNEGLLKRSLQSASHNQYFPCLLQSPEGSSELCFLSEQSPQRGRCCQLFSRKVMHNLRPAFYGCGTQYELQEMKEKHRKQHGSQPGLLERTFSTHPPPPPPPPPPHQQQLWDREGLGSCTQEERGRLGMLEGWEWSFMAWDWPHCIMQRENMIPNTVT